MSHLLENMANGKCKTPRKKQKHTKLEVQKQNHRRKEDNTFINERDCRTLDFLRQRALL
jgi:hypothetical protein